MKHVFGKSIAYSFSPLIDGVPVSANSIVSARLYASEPTNAQKEDSTAVAGGFLGSAVTTWASQGKGEYTITFPALTDSAPHSSDSYEDYYVVVSFKFESTGPTVFVSEKIFVYRPDAWTSRITTTFLDVIALESKIEAFKTEAEINRSIELSKDRIFRRLKRLGAERRKMFNLEELNQAVLYLAASLICGDLASEDAQFWMTKADRHFAAYEEIFPASAPGYDDTDDQSASPDATISTGGPAYVSR